MKFTRLHTLLLTATVITPVAHAQLLGNPATNAGESTNQYGIYLGSSSTEYDIDETDNSGDISRSFLVGSIARGLSDSLDIYGALNYGFDVDGGTGTELGIGLKGDLKFLTIEGYDIKWYSQLSVFDEELEDEDLDVTTENVLSEWLLGTVAVKQINPDLKVYGGLELVAYTLGEAVQKKEFIDDTKSDFERSNRVGLRAGLEYKSAQLHVGLGHESGFMVGLTLPIDGFSMPKMGLPKSEEPVSAPVEPTPPAAKPEPTEGKPTDKEIDLDLYTDDEEKPVEPAPVTPPPVVEPEPEPPVVEPAPEPPVKPEPVEEPKPEPKPEVKPEVPAEPAEPEIREIEFDIYAD